MAVFIEITTDAFQENFARKSAAAQASRRAGAARVRRPLRGLEIKEDTYAIIKVIQADGTELPLLDSGTETGTGTQYANFILQAVQEARMEKHQIVETFGEAYIFFFGEAPRFLDVTAVLINSNDFNWEAEWWANYNAYFRGTKSVELGARTYLFYDDNIVEGYMLQAQAVKTSDQPLMVQLTFRLFLTNYQNISFIGDPNFPTRSSITLPDSVPSLSQGLNSEQINALVGNQVGFDSNGFALGGFDLQVNGPLRSRFVDNLDEFTGPPPEGGPNPFDALRQQVERDLAEASDLTQILVDQLSAYGVNASTPAFMLALGLGPTFSQSQGFGIGAGASSSASASFGASATNVDTVDASYSFGSSASVSVDTDQQELDEAAYQQLLATRAQATLDENGGALSVSSFGATSRSNTSSVNAGASFAGGVSAGAGVSVGGSVSAFAMASFDGDFDATGQANAFASASVGG